MTIFFITILAAMALHSLYLISNLFLGFATNKTILSSINITRIAFIFIYWLPASRAPVVIISLITIYMRLADSQLDQILVSIIVFFMSHQWLYQLKQKIIKIL